MKKFQKVLVLLVLINCVCSIFVFTACNSNEQKDETKYVTITDMLGEQVQVVKNPRKVACVSRTTYDLLIAFGLGDYIDGVYSSLLENEWANVFDSKASERYSCAYTESYETFISRGVDVVFAPEKYIADDLKEHGVTALNVSLYGNPSFDEYVYFFADMVKQMWDSKEVAAKVDNWKFKMSSTISTIQTELAKHNDTQRTIYYVRGDKNKGIGYTDTGKSFVEYAYKVLGMNYLGATLGTTKPSAEAICEANPDVFVVGGIYQKTLIASLSSAPYKDLDAVKNNQVYNIPMGLTMFEQLSVFSPVFLCDQANKLYPSYFSFDTAQMIKDYSLEFFGVELTTTEVNNMLNGLSREGNALA